MVKKAKNRKRENILRLILLIAGIIFLNTLLWSFFVRIDLTEEKRYSLTNATKNLVGELDDVVFIKVYLEGEFSSSFKRLRDETKYLLEEFRSYSNGNIEFEFIDPSEGADTLDGTALQKQLYKKGIFPITDQSTSSTEFSERVVFPGAIFKYKGKEQVLNLISEQVSMDVSGKIDKAIAGLEFGIASTIRKITTEKKPAVGFLGSHGTLTEPELADVGRTLFEYYDVKGVNLKESLALYPDVIKALIIPKPTEPFSEKDKFKLDQYIMHGGKVLWLIDPVRASLDSLGNQQSAFLAAAQNLNLDDLLFKYGARINKNLVQDLECVPIPILGQGGVMMNKDWVYYPLLSPANKHPVVNNLDKTLVKFASTVDTVGENPNIKKTVLLTTSGKSRVVYAPTRISLSMVRYPQPPGVFNNGAQHIAVLLEGEFESMYKHRVQASPEFSKILRDSLDMEYRDKSFPTKMIVVGDGDIIRNSISGHPFEQQLGFYKYTREIYANKEFIVNAVEYLCDESGIIGSKSKDVKIRLLDPNKVKLESTKWQMMNIAGPILVLFIFGVVYNFIRLRRYSNKI